MVKVKDIFNMPFFLPKKLKTLTLYKLKIFSIIFLTVSAGCLKKEKTYSACLTREEKKDLEYFLKFFMGRESGAFVLFGSKPLCDSGFFEVESKAYRRDFSKGWEAWEKVKKEIHGNRFIFVKTHIVPMKIQWPDKRKDERIFHRIVLADVQKTAFVLAENYEFFKAMTGMDFHPFEIVFDLENPESIFWNKIFDYSGRECSHQEIVENTMANGLLYGFGKKNTLLFTWKRDFMEREGRGAEFFKRERFTPHDFNAAPKYSLSEQVDKWADALEPPGFMSLEDDDVIEKYEKEVKKIRQIYRGKNFLEFTLRQLAQ